MRARVTELREAGDKLFSARGSLMSLWQEVGDHFYPERAHFTRSYVEGEEFAPHLMTGYPALIRRELANAISSMLRPRGKPWFQARTDNDSINNDAASRAFLDRISDRMRRIMYARKAKLLRAVNQGDHDWATFGQCAISLDIDRAEGGLIYRSHHLRDCVWAENSKLEIDTVHRKQKLQARQIVRLFKDVHKTVGDAAEKEPFREFEVREIVLPAEEYDLARKARHPFVCIYIDTANQHILEETPIPVFKYLIPRWVTVSGSQYAHSPATMIALPDARLLQRITLTLLEAGEKAVDPPLKGVQEAVQGPVNAYAGGVTWVDAQYDERSGAAFERLYDGNAQGDLGWGVDREQRVAELISKAFFLDKVQVPFIEGDMTATEYRGRMQEYIRQALPLFEPMEVEYNGGLCELTFQTIEAYSGFGPLWQEMPRTLAGKEINWQFDSPLQEANEREKANAFVESAQLLKIAAEIDPLAVHDYDVRTAFRDALMGSGAPAEWTVDKDEADEARAAAQQAQQALQAATMAAQAAGMAGEAAQNVGAGVQQLEQAGLA